MEAHRKGSGAPRGKFPWYCITWAWMVVEHGSNRLVSRYTAKVPRYTNGVEDDHDFLAISNVPVLGIDYFSGVHTLIIIVIDCMASLIIEAKDCPDLSRYQSPSHWCL